MLFIKCTNIFIFPYFFLSIVFPAIFHARSPFRDINYYYIYLFLKGDHIFMGYAYMNQSCSCPSQTMRPCATQTVTTQTCAPQASMAQTSVPQASMAQTSAPQASMAQTSSSRPSMAQTQPSSSQPSMAQPASRYSQAAVSANTYGFYCPDTAPGGMEQYPVGMGYVPWQQWQQTYPLEQGFNRGTIFPDLDLPFMMGRCIR